MLTPPPPFTLQANTALPLQARQRNANWAASLSEKESCVSVMFADLVDFHKIVTQHSPMMLVSLLDRVYSLL